MAIDLRVTPILKREDGEHGFFCEVHVFTRQWIASGKVARSPEGFKVQDYLPEIDKAMREMLTLAGHEAVTMERDLPKPSAIVGADGGHIVRRLEQTEQTEEGA